MTSWSQNMSDAEVIRAYQDKSNELDMNHEMIYKLEADLHNWNISAKIVGEDFEAIANVMHERGLMNDDHEGPERYMCGSDLW